MIPESNQPSSPGLLPWLVGAVLRLTLVFTPAPTVYLIRRVFQKTGAVTAANLEQGAPGDVDVRRDLRYGDDAAERYDLYLPAGVGAWPTILIQTPYDKSLYHGAGLPLPTESYAWVILDWRGHYGSSAWPEGTYRVDVLVSTGGFASTTFTVGQAVQTERPGAVPTLAPGD